MASLEVNFCGVKFGNPTVLASGILGVTASSLKSAVRKGAGGVTTKSIWLEEHVGHKNPTMYGTEHYFLNAVGLSDAGMEKARTETFPEYLGVETGTGLDSDKRSMTNVDSRPALNMDKRPAPIIANIVASSMEDFAKLTEEITECGPDVIELNLGCPNVEDQHGKPFSCVAADAAKVVKMCRARTKKPLIVKLTPNVADIATVAKACAAEGADGFCAINTLYGMGIDINLRRPILANVSGGLSGPGIKPAAVRAVYSISRATGLPIIGTGGVMTGEDVIEMMMAGARLVGMGTMVYYRGVEGFGKIVKEIDDWCEKNGVKNLEEIIGCVLL